LKFVSFDAYLTEQWGTIGFTLRAAPHPSHCEVDVAQR
jgi:hypothetical protein